MKAKNIEPIKTVLIITVGFIVIYLITKCYWAIIVSLIFGLSGLSSSLLSKKINLLWMKFTWLLSLIIPNILLLIIFYFILFPLSVLAKLFGNRDPLHLKNTMESNFKQHDKKFDKKYFENPW